MKTFVLKFDLSKQGLTNSMLQKKYAIASIISVLSVIMLLATQIPKLDFDYNFESFFPIDDPDLEFYQAFTEEFGFDNDYLMICLDGKSGIFDTTFVNAAIQLTHQLDTLSGSLQVISPFTYKKFVKSPMGYIPLRQFHPESKEKLLNDSLRLLKDEFMREIFFSKDFNNIKLVVVHDRFINPIYSDQYLEKVENLLKVDQLGKTRLVGRIAAQRAFLNALKVDFSRFLIVSVILVTLMLIIFMRKANLVIIALSISGLSILATLGLFVVTEKKIDVLSTLIPSILLVVSMSDIIHLFAQIRNEYALTEDKFIAIKAGVKKVGWATFLTSITTSVGFLTLVTIQVEPIISLGLYSAAGIIIAYVVTYMMFPQVMSLSTPKIKEGRSQLRVDNFLQWTTSAIFSKGKMIMWISTVFVVFVAFGLSQLRIDARLLDDLPDSDQVKLDFQFFDKEYGGSKPFTMSVMMIDSTKPIYSKEAIIELEKLVNIADSTFDVSHLISPATFVKSVNQSLNGGKLTEYRLPRTDIEWKRTLSELNRLKPWEKLNLKTKPNQAQISGFDKDIGSAASAKLAKKFRKIAGKNIDQNMLSYQVTGTSALINKSNDSLSYNLLEGIFSAVFMVALISGLMFKSWRMVFITLVPNLIPILAVGAAMGFLDIPINMGSSVIFAISFGIVVDDSIHFLSKFRLEKRKGLSNDQSIKNTVKTTGEAIILTTLILTIGFVVFCFSNFTATFYIGLFVSISFIVALLADLFLLPVLILRFIPDRNVKN